MTVDDLQFSVRRSERRKSIGITVERDGRLVITAPVDFGQDVIEQTAREKLFWVYTKLAEKETLSRPWRPKEFVSGEGFLYLGRSYRLLLPPRIIEYIVAHELAHIHEPNHTPEFWRRLERAMPDYAARKQWLAENGGSR